MFQPKSNNNQNINNEQELSMGNKVFIENENGQKNNLENGYISSESDINVSTNIPNNVQSENIYTQPNDDDIHYMPEKFLQPTNAFKSNKNWFLIIGIILIVIVVLAVGGFAFYVLTKEKIETPETVLDLPPKTETQNQENIENNTENKLDTPKLRDEKRIKDIKDIMSALSLYYNDNKKYPSVLDRLDKYIKEIPSNPEPGGEPYYYQPQDKSQDYILTFSLESGAELGNLILKANKYKATSKAGVEIYKDSSFEAGDNNDTASTTEQYDQDNSQGLLPIPPKGNDIDKDGLTDIEELMFGTKINISDSDGDGYSDGSEIYSLYDPLNPNVKLVDNIDLVRAYDNENYYYSVLYPKNWKIDIKNTNFNEVTFSNDPNSDFFQVQIRENSQGLSLQNWYLSNSENSKQSDLKSFNNKNIFGIQKKDGMYVYLSNANKIYIISYIIKNTKSLEYFKTFEMFLQSFKFINVNIQSNQQNISPQGENNNEG